MAAMGPSGGAPNTGGAGKSVARSCWRSLEDMTRLSLFNSPLLLGFDHFERTLDRIAKAGAEGYPPYNIEQIGEDRLRITLAVAGFGLDDLEIQIEDNQLTIKGRQKDDPDRVYLYRGIAARQFQRSFVLAEGIIVNAAALDNGLLSVDLQRPKAVSQVRTVPISKAGGEKSKRVTVDANSK
jgi:HSP20 family molecular chaperone IbpA